jgi:hypothetical protein
MGKQAGKMNSTQVISELESQIEKNQHNYKKQIESVRAELSAAVASYRQVLDRKVDEIKPDITKIEDPEIVHNVLKALVGLKEFFDKKIKPHKELCERLEREQSDAFLGYRRVNDSAFSKALKQTCKLAAERVVVLSNGNGKNGIESLQKELQALKQLSKDIHGINKNSPIIQQCNERQAEIQQKIESISENYEKYSSITSDPLYMPVEVSKWDKGASLKYVSVKNNQYTELFDRAVMRALRQAGIEFMPVNGCMHAKCIHSSPVDANLVDLVTKELKKPEYEELRKANVVPKFYAVPTNGKQVLELINGNGKQETESVSSNKKQDKQNENREPIQSRQLARNVGVHYSVLKNIIYMENRDLLVFRINKNGLWYWTPEGQDAVAEYISNRGKYSKPAHRPGAEPAQKPAPSPPKKTSRVDQMYEMVKQGKSVEAIAKKFNLSESHTSKTLSSNGIITPFRMSRDYNSLKLIQKAKFDRAYQYNSEKQKIRDEMLEEMIAYLSDPEHICYLGLEGPNFGSYINLTALTQVDPKKSLVAEYDKKAFFTMDCIVRNWGKIEGGKVFKGLNVHFGNLSESLDFHLDKKFNFLNLDYMGSFSKEKVETLDKLFKHNLLMDEAVLYITLSNHERDREKLKNGYSGLPDKYKNGGFGTGDQHKIVKTYLEKLAAENGRKITEINTKEYKSKKTPMLFMSYKVERM